MVYGSKGKDIFEIENINKCRDAIYRVSVGLFAHCQIERDAINRVSTETNK